jgi:S-adenosyl-L-methionine hydrolase (adenosine-forming)
MARPVIALLTDFGTRDHYAGAMKGVALGICPDAVLVDVTHDIPPHDVAAGALELAGAYKYFPSGTIFVAVVDPGVGSSRRGIAAEASGYRFVSPDNGVLSLVFRDSAPRRVVELTERKYARPTVSRTFEGRDRFAPAAAWLARGIDLAALGRPVTAWSTLALHEPVVLDGRIDGEVWRVDRFGNVITNIDRATFSRIANSGAITIAAGAHAIDRLVSTYAEAPTGTVCALFGSTDHLELAVNGGSAAAALGIARGAPVTVSRE